MSRGFKILKYLALRNETQLSKAKAKGKYYENHIHNKYENFLFC